MENMALVNFQRKKMPDFMLIFSTFFGCTDALRKKHIPGFGPAICPPPHSATDLS